MKNYLTLLLILFCLTNVLGQGKEEKFITTEEQNAAWIADFNNKNIEGQPTKKYITLSGIRMAKRL